MPILAFQLVFLTIHDELLIGCGQGAFIVSFFGYSGPEYC